ncbi:MAG: hypothetical protein AAF456_14365 [Planctomycetota bacterium]
MKSAALLIVSISLLVPAVAYALKVDKDRRVARSVENNRVFYSLNPNADPRGNYISKPDFAGQKFRATVYMASAGTGAAGGLLAIALFWIAANRDESNASRSPISALESTELDS